MLTGNAFKVFSSDASKDFIASLIHDQEVRENYKKIHLGLSAVIRLVNSQNEMIDVSMLRDL